MDNTRALVVLELVRLWRHRWFGFGAACVATVVGLIAVAMIPNRYTTTARIYVDTESLVGPALAGIALERNIATQIEYMQRTLLRRPNLERLARSAGMVSETADAATMERTVLTLNRELKLLPQGHNMLQLSFNSNDPRVSHMVITHLLDIFVEGNVGDMRQDVSDTLRLLTNQISVYEGRLDEAEKRLAEFKLTNMAQLSSNGDYYARLTEARKGLQGARADAAESATRVAKVREQLATIPATLQSRSSGGPPSGLEVRMFELSSQLDALLLKYTDAHPDVVNTRRMIAELEKQQDAELAAASAAAVEQAGQPATGVPNPLYEKLKLQLVEEEAKHAAVSSRLKENETNLRAIEKMMTAAPEVEAQLTKLNRDYQINKSNYEQLLRRKESLEIANEMDSQVNRLHFRIVDPPLYPNRPSWPNRLLFDLAVFPAALAIGIAVAFAMGRLSGTIFTPAELGMRSGLPVLGTIAAQPSAAERRRRMFEGLGLGMGTALLAAMCVLLAKFTALPVV